jgi:hypothetical protein
MLFNVTEEQQHAASQWFLNYEKTDHLNIYFHTNETDVPWLLHAMAVSKYKYINIDNIDGVANCLASYILGKPNTYFSITDPSLASLLGYINTNRVDNIEDFFERTLGADNQ